MDFIIPLIAFLIFLTILVLMLLGYKTKYYFLALKRAGDFSGRSNRSEFWYFTLFSLIISGLLQLVEGAKTRDDSVLVGIYSFFIILPSISLFIRRMHDINKSGWFILIPFWNLIFASYKGTKGTNRFGPESKINF